MRQLFPSRLLFDSANVLTCTLSLICDCTPAGQQDCSHSPLVFLLAMLLLTVLLLFNLPAESISPQLVSAGNFAASISEQIIAAHCMQGCVRKPEPSWLSLTDALLACAFTCDCTIVCQASLAVGSKVSPAAQLSDFRHPQPSVLLVCCMILLSMCRLETYCRPRFFGV